MSRFLFVWLAICATLAAGCGDSLNLAPASGTITYKGAPVEGAFVTFKPEKGPLGTGTTDASGKYTISTDGKAGAVVGKNGVMVAKSGTAIQGMPANPKPEDMMKMMSQGKGGRPTPLGKAELPTKYGTLEGSGLSAEVTSDGTKNVFDFDLKD